MAMEWHSRSDASSEPRFKSLYQGKCSNNRDPEKRGRIKAVVPFVLGPSTETTWALPSGNSTGIGSGMFDIPEEGSQVWIEFQDGNPSKPVWRGGWWVQGDIGYAIPKEAKIGYPHVRVFKTPGGHAIIWDDNTNSKKTTIISSTGHSVTLDDHAQQLVVQSAKGIKHIFNDVKGQLNSIAPQLGIGDIFDNMTAQQAVMLNQHIDSLVNTALKNARLADFQRYTTLLTTVGTMTTAQKIAALATVVDGWIPAVTIPAGTPNIRMRVT